MKKLLVILASAGFAMSAFAADIRYTKSEILTFNEETDYGKISMTFQKCMQNKLFTFYTISLNGKVINSASSSDNIGPFNVSGGVWMGGNHNTPQGGSKPSAYTRSVEISVDGNTLVPGASKEGKVMTIVVKNEIFYTDDKKFADEMVTYTVSGNSIDVKAQHNFAYPSNMMVARYYGAQSMCPATEILLPGTLATIDNKTQENIGWITGLSTKSSIDVLKSKYPKFSTIVEKNANGYQAIYKYDEGMGDASLISSSGDIVLWRRYGGATGKSYHVMMWDHTVKSGDVTTWHALYSWFDKPVNDTFQSNDNAPVFEYMSNINGQETIMHVGADGAMTATAGINDIIADNCPNFANVFAGGIYIDEATPDACIYNISGTLVHSGAGMFDCPAGLYIATDGNGHSVKLLVK